MGIHNMRYKLCYYFHLTHHCFITKREYLTLMSRYSVTDCEGLTTLLCIVLCILYSLQQLTAVNVTIFRSNFNFMTININSLSLVPPSPPLPPNHQISPDGWTGNVTILDNIDQTWEILGVTFWNSVRQLNTDCRCDWF